MPAARSRASAAAGLPAQRASAARRPLRRMPKAASTAAKVAARSPGGGGRRTSPTRPESTFGSGQNTFRPTEPARRTSPYQAAFTDGTPYAEPPGGAASRSATSACTRISARSSEGSSSSRCSRTGTATL